jgi:IAA-amino acid hydrolase
VHAAHSPHFLVDDGALPYGAAMHANLAIEYLRNHAIANRSVGPHDEL